MRIIKRLLTALLPGVISAAVIIVLSQLLLKNLGEIIAWASGVFGMDETVTMIVSQVLGQLQNADIASPWVETLVVTCGVNIVLDLLIRRGVIRKLVINIIWYLALLAGVLWFTRINGILLGDVIRQILPILQSGLF